MSELKQYTFGAISSERIWFMRPMQRCHSPPFPHCKKQIHNTTIQYNTMMHGCDTSNGAHVLSNRCCTSCMRILSVEGCGLFMYKTQRETLRASKKTRFRGKKLARQNHRYHLVFLQDTFSTRVSDLLGSLESGYDVQYHTEDVKFFDIVKRAYTEQTSLQQRRACLFLFRWSRSHLPKSFDDGTKTPNETHDTAPRILQPAERTSASIQKVTMGGGTPGR